MLQRLAVLISVLLFFASNAMAQNVTGYDTMPDPILFLLREPAVQDDLALTESQIQQLTKLNESLDAKMLGSRANKTKEEANAITTEVMETTRAAIAKFFTKDQLMRLRQIKFRLRGISFVLLPDIVKVMKLTKEQQDAISAATESANQKVKKVYSNEFQGAERQAESERVIVAARKEEQKTILATLNQSQKLKLSELIGEEFDSNSLGEVAFKAPQLIDSDEWVNCEGLELSDLRGKVVALHFFAYG